MLRSITVSGEVSNVKYHSSGHIYFTMKDNNGAISCVMFATSASKMTFKLTNGLAVETTGSISVFERDGKYQLYAYGIKKAGDGELYEKYEALKKKLYAAGMFDEKLKRPIPKYAKKIGIVTAETGAAIRDITQIASRRNPYVQLYLYPALVQGEGAKESIVKGINYLENFGVDVIIVGRGGGSIEDLWAFNEECVAEAIFNCSVPVVSAVGHETDTTIADYVSDLRAPTPSAAAELTVFSYEKFSDNVDLLKHSLEHYMKLIIANRYQTAQHFKMQLDAMSPANRIREKKIKSVNLKMSLDNLINRKLNDAKYRVGIDIERLKAANPLEKLDKGYALATGPDGNRLKNAKAVKTGDDIRLHLKDGVVDASVTGVEITKGISGDE